MSTWAPNFCACVIGACREFLPGDTVRKAEVVLDSRTRARLSSRRIGFQHQDIEPFRCPVHGRRQPRRPGTDDDQIADLRPVDGNIEAKAVRELLVARIPQHMLTPVADNDRHLFDSDLKAIEQLLDVRVAFHIDGRVGLAIAREELPDAKRSGGMARADEHQVSNAPRNQFHPPQDEGPHEDFAQLAVGLHKSQQLIAVQLNDFAGLARAKSHQYAAPRKQVKLSGELTCPADGYDFLNVARYPDGFYLTCFDHEEMGGFLARFNQAPRLLSLAAPDHARRRAPPAPASVWETSGPAARREAAPMMVLCRS